MVLSIRVAAQIGNHKILSGLVLDNSLEMGVQLARLADEVLIVRHTGLKKKKNINYCQLA